MSADIEVNNTPQERRFSTANWIEFTFPLYFVVILLYANATGEYSGISANGILLYFASTIPLATIVIGGTALALGRNDYRFHLSFHFVVSGYAASMMGIFWFGTGVMDPETYQSASTFWPALGAFIVVVGGQMVYFMAGVFAALALTNPFTRKLTHLTDEVTSGNYAIQIEDDATLRDSVFGPIAELLNNVIETTSQVVLTLRGTINLVSTTSEKIEDSSSEVNRSTNEVASTSQTMAMGASQQAEMVTNMLVLIDTMDQELNSIITRIQDNAQIVSQIALQTNILALNAGIEASRAGDYGRGFAVVAENVRRLSEETKSATEEIAEVVSNISLSLRDTFGNIAGRIEEVASVAEETSASAEEVAASAEQVSSSMMELTELSIQLNEYTKRSEALLKGVEIAELYLEEV